MVGQRFGRLTVIKDSGKKRHYTVLWLCHGSANNYSEVY
jgi:hypothetical protein